MQIRTPAMFLMMTRQLVRLCLDWMASQLKTLHHISWKRRRFPCLVRNTVVQVLFTGAQPRITLTTMSVFSVSILWPNVTWRVSWAPMVSAGYSGKSLYCISFLDFHRWVYYNFPDLLIDFVNIFSAMLRQLENASFPIDLIIQFHWPIRNVKKCLNN